MNERRTLVQPAKARAAPPKAPTAAPVKTSSGQRLVPAPAKIIPHPTLQAAPKVAHTATPATRSAPSAAKAIVTAQARPETLTAAVERMLGQGYSVQQVEGQIHRWHPGWSASRIRRDVVLVETPAPAKGTHEPKPAQRYAPSAAREIGTTQPATLAATSTGAASRVSHSHPTTSRRRTPRIPVRSAGLTRALPSVSVAFTRTKTVTLKSPQVTITAHATAEALVSQEHGSSRISLDFDPKKRGGLLKLNADDLALTMGSVLSKSQLRNRDMIAQLFRHASIGGTATDTISLGMTSITIGGKRFSVPVTAVVSISASLPGTVEAELAVDIPIWDKRGNLTTIELTVSVDAEVAIHPKPRSTPWDPIPAVAHEYAREAEKVLQTLTEILRHVPRLPVPGGGSAPLPEPAP